MAKARHRSASAQRGFTALENAILFDTRLSPGARVLYGALKHYAWRGDGEVPAQAALAEALGATKKTVGQWFKELEAHRLVSVERRPGQQSVILIEEPGTGVEITPVGGVEITPVAESFLPRSARVYKGQDLEDGSPSNEGERAGTSSQPVQAAVDRALRLAVYGSADVKLTRDEARAVAVAATKIRQAGGAPVDVAERAARYRRHDTYGSCALTAPALARHWTELAPTARLALAPCGECGIGGGQHLVDCAAAA